MEVRLLVRQQGHRINVWVDMGMMERYEADRRRKGWNLLGYGCLILKHNGNPGLRIVPVPIQAMQVSGYVQ